MKRQLPIENPSIFSILPSEVFYKIQYLLNAVSFIYFSSTCKALYETRNDPQNFKKEEIYRNCLHRIINYLEERNLLTFTKKFLHQFNSVLCGNLVNEYLYTGTGTHPLLISIPKHISFNDALAYIKEKTKSNDVIIFDDLNLIAIDSKSNNSMLTFIHEVENLESYSEERVPHLNIKMSLDFQNLYCDNLWKLLKSKEDLEDKFNPTLKE